MRQILPFFCIFSFLYVIEAFYAVIHVSGIAKM